MPEIRRFLRALPGLVLCLAACQSTTEPRPAVHPPSRSATKVKPLRQVFGAHQPFAFVLPQMGPVKGVGVARATRCRGCHVQIHGEWARSTHAGALRDLQFQAELYKKGSPRWLCLNCHIPVQNQRARIVRGLRGGDVMRPVSDPNPGFDPAMQKEAITCAACHVRGDGTGRTWIVGLRGHSGAPHPVRADPQGLRNVCLRCHDPKGKRITPLLVCWFKTREELQQGPYGGKKQCVDCHLPKTRRRLAAAFTDQPVRLTGRHVFLGSGIPKQYGGYDHLIARGWRPGTDVQLVSWRFLQGSPSRVRFEVAVTNARAGHHIPTGDPERFLLLQVELLDRDGRRLARVTHRIGQVWIWSPRAKKVSDNRLKPRERRVWSGTLGAKAGSPSRLRLTVYHARLSSKTARYMQRHARPEETYVLGARQKIRQLARYYPLANFVYREVVDVQSGARTVASLAALVALSRAEARKPLSARDY